MCAFPSLSLCFPNFIFILPNRVSRNGEQENKWKERKRVKVVECLFVFVRSLLGPKRTCALILNYEDKEE